MDWPDPERAQTVLPPPFYPRQLWATAEPLRVGVPMQVPGISIVPSTASAVYKGCTREAQRMPTLETGVQLSCIRGAPLVHGAKSRRAGEAHTGGNLRLRESLQIPSQGVYRGKGVFSVAAGPQTLLGSPFSIVASPERDNIFRSPGVALNAGQLGSDR